MPRLLLCLMPLVLVLSACATSSRITRVQPPEGAAPVVDEGIVAYHTCLGHEMGGYLDIGGSPPEIVATILQRCDSSLDTLDQRLASAGISPNERQRVKAEARDEGEEMMVEHLTQILAVQAAQAQLEEARAAADDPAE